MGLSSSPGLKEEIYDEHLQEISGIRFTLREMDVIACMLHHRGEKKIASFLAISYRTVSAHAHNIRNKIGSSARDGIIDIVEKSGKLPYIRKYYACLLIDSSFKRHLKKIAALFNRNGVTCALIQPIESVTNSSLLSYMESDLKVANISVKAHKKQTPGEKCDFYLCIIDGADDLKSLLGPGTRISIVLDSDIEPYDFTKSKYIKLSEQNYHEAMLQLLTIILGKKDKLLEIIEEYKNEFRAAKDAYTDPLTGQKNQTNLPVAYVESGASVIRNNKNILRILIAFGIIFIAIVFFVIRLNNIENTYERRNLSSDLPLPHQSILLERSEILEEIDNKLSGKEGVQTVVLVGPGGAGKTTIAYQYARLKAKKNFFVWKFNAESKDSFIASMKYVANSMCKTDEAKQRLASILEIKNENERHQNLFEFLKDKIVTHPDWLIIYNNVGTFSDIKEYYPYDSEIWGNGKVIITTRDCNIAYSNYILPENVIYVPELTEIENQELFAKVLSDSGSRTPLYQTEMLQFLSKIPAFPLDVSLAANYIKQTQIPYQEYLDGLSEQNDGFVASQKAILNDMGEYIHTRTNIVSFSIKQIENMHPDFKSLLLFISLLDSENIPKNLLVSYTDEITTNKFIHELKKFSLILENHDFEGEGLTTFTIHRSTQEVIKNYLIKSVGQIRSRGNDLYRMSEVLASYISTNTDKMLNLISHAEAFLTYTKSAEIQCSLKLDLQLGNYYFRKSDYKRAIKILEGALSYGGSDSEEVMNQILVRLGSVYRNIGEYSKAKGALEKALSFYAKRYGLQDIKTIEVLIYMGSVYRNLGDYNKAVKILEHALERCKQHYGNNHIEIARCLAYLGSVYKNLGNYKEATVVLENARDIYEKQYSPDHIHVAWILTRLGNLYKSLGNYRKAKKVFEDALATYKNHYGENCIEHAWTLVYLGSVENELGNYVEARKILEKAKEIYTQHLRPDHVTFAWALLNLADTNQKLGNPQIARDPLEHVLKIYEGHYGKDHIQTAWVMHGIGSNYLQMNDLETAEHYFKQSIAPCTKIKCVESCILFDSLADLYMRKSTLLRNAGNITKANECKRLSFAYAKEALSIAEEILPADSPQIAKFRSHLVMRQMQEHKT